MKTKLEWSDGISLGVIAAMAAATGYLYPQLPAAFPTHFGLDGHVNGTTAKPLGPWVLPGIAAALWLVLRFAAMVLPGEWKDRMSKSPMAATTAALTALLGGCQAVSLYAALRPGADLNVPILSGLGVFMIVLGQFYPRLRRNPLVGCRTTFTLSSDENWARTHRFGGFTMTIGGFMMIPLAFVSPLASVVVLFASLLSQVVYSFALEHKLASEARSETK